MQGDRHQGGFSLIEVLIAAVVMAIGLAGLAALLLQSVGATSNAGRQSVAALLAESLATQMRLTPGLNEIYVSAAPDSTALCTGPAACAPEVFTRYNLALWHAEIAAALPRGHGVICYDTTPDDGMPGAESCDGAGPGMIKLFWPDPAGPGFRRHAIEIWP